MINNTSTNTGLEKHFIDTRQITWLAFVFIIGVILSVTVFFLVRDLEHSEKQKIFEYSARSYLDSFQIDIVRHQEVVNSIAGLFSASEHVTQEEFHTFIQDTLSRHPTIHGLSWNPLIRNVERKQFIDKVREDGMSDFQITELNDKGQRVKATTKGDYVVVHYIEPYLGNKEAKGFNIASDPVRLKAINRARDTGEAIITERIKLVQEKEDSFGYLLFRAVYKRGSPIITVAERRKNFVGLAVGVFRFSDWKPYSMQDMSLTDFNVLLTDESSPMGKKFLHFYQSEAHLVDFQSAPQYRREVENGIHWRTTFNVEDRKWAFLFSPTPAFFKKQRHWQASAFLATGLFVSILITFYLFARAQNINKRKQAQFALIAAHDEANRANLAKSEFLSHMSHELRTPMNAILGFAQLLQMADEELNETQQDNVQEIIDAGNHLMYLINDVLDLSKIESGRLEISMEDVSLNDVLEQSIALVSSQAEAHNVEIIDLVNTEGCMVLADFTRLKQVLINLLSNAIKYGHDHSQITLDCKIMNNQYLRLYVKDAGDGLTEEEITKLFVPFERLNTISKIEGTGVGLVITKYLVEHMNGAIGVESILDKGSTFWIELKLSQAT